MRPRKRIVQFVSVLVIYLSLFRVLVPVSEAHAGGKGGVLPGSDPGRLSFNVPSDRGSISSASYGDGTVRKGSVGSYDAKDFRLIDGRMGEPRFAAESTPDHVGPTTSCSDGWYDGPPVNGIDGFVDAIAVDGAGNVYAGGSFRVAGSSIVNNIAKWNGSSWSALSTGTNAEVHSIAVSGTDIFVGGNFTTAGGIAAKHVAKWNGSSWSPVGTGLEHPAFDLKISGTTVYAGTGSWDPVSQSGEGYVSMWNGAGWSDLGPQIGFIVDSIAVSGKAVYAVGSGQIVKWNGSDWFDLSSGFDGEFHDVVVSGGDVYSAGHRYIGGGAALASI